MPPVRVELTTFRLQGERINHFAKEALTWRVSFDAKNVHIPVFSPNAECFFLVIYYVNVHGHGCLSLCPKLQYGIIPIWNDN